LSLVSGTRYLFLIPTSTPSRGGLVGWTKKFGGKNFASLVLGIDYKARVQINSPDSVNMHE